MFLMNREAAASITCTGTALTSAFVLAGEQTASARLPPLPGCRSCFSSFQRGRLNLIKALICSI